MDQGAVTIGTWRFDPAGGELVRGAERRRLEDRTARTLELLARRRGEVVPHAEIVAQVWDGRRQSANSVAIVISDLRRALGDDARAQTLIETVPKRGYRLRAEAPGSSAAPRRLRRGWIAVSGLATAAALAAAWTGLRPQRPSVRIEAVINATGSRDYDALARSVESLVTTDLQARGRVDVLALEASRRPDLVVRGRLILWTGHPAVELTAVDRARGLTVWSGLAPGPEAQLPAQIDHSLETFGRGRGS